MPAGRDEINAQADAKDVVRQVIDAWRRRDADALEALADEGFVYRSPGHPDVTDRASYRRMAQEFFDAFPDFSLRTDALIGEGDRAVHLYTVEGTHLGELKGLGEMNGIAPTGKRITFGGVAVCRVIDGKAAEVIEYADYLGLIEQLGVPLVPAPSVVAQ